MHPLIESVVNISLCSRELLHNLHTLACQSQEVTLLDIHQGKSVNRSVLTLCGTPNAMKSFLFSLFTFCKDNIDMRLHKGSHPRIGAIDVCPIIPIRGVTTQECTSFVQSLAHMVSSKLHIPIHLYAHSARTEQRRNLFHLRRGNYEELPQKMALAPWSPDLGPTEWSDSVARTGVSVIGHRDLMVAWNLSLDASLQEAKKIASQIRESGIIRNGVRIPGIFPSLRAIGWYIPEYRCAQISINIYDIKAAPMPKVFAKTQELAKGKIFASERIGLIPLQALGCTPRTGVEDVKIIAKKMAFQDFKPKQHILEYAIAHHIDQENFSCPPFCL